LNIVKNSRGFTLIEIVIVIAIAALILAAVLIFVPQAQASQRDGQRRQNVGRVLAKASECASNVGSVCTRAQMDPAYMVGINMPGSSTQYTLQTNALACSGGSGSDTGVMRYQKDTPAVGEASVSVCLEGSTTAYSQNN
jgi:prepilin-type N-terminal cleavage/methylation domain-containing protein